MQLKTKLEASLILFVIVSITTFGIVWHKKSLENAVTAQKVESQQALIDQAQKDKKDRAQEFADQIEKLQKLKAQIVTVPGATQVIREQQPAFSSTEVRKDQVAPDVKLPDSPSNSFQIVSKEHLIADAQNIVQCQIEEAKGNRCTKDLADEKIISTEAIKQRDEWKRTAQGGSLVSRVFKGAIKVGIGIGIGYAVAKVAH